MRSGWAAARVRERDERTVSRETRHGKFGMRISPGTLPSSGWVESSATATILPLSASCATSTSVAPVALSVASEAKDGRVLYHTTSRPEPARRAAARAFGEVQGVPPEREVVHAAVHAREELQEGVLAGERIPA